MWKSYLFVVATLSMLTVCAQTENKKSANRIVNIQFHYTLMNPEMDLANRFGLIHNIGTGGLYKTSGNWLFGGDVSYQFGSEVKEQFLLFNLTNSVGTVMNTAGSPASFVVGMRGLNGFLKIGKVFPVTWKNQNSGIVVMAGAGMYYHKINISATRNDIPTLTEDLKKGYDRLSSGPAFNQFVGYYFHSHNRYINFYIGLDVMQAFTKSIRGYNYDTRQYDNQQRFDMTVGARLGWMIPIYLEGKSDTDEFEYK